MGDQVSFGLAFIAGILSFLSPCVLPLVPGYISFLSGSSLEDLEKGSSHKKVLIRAGLKSVFFVAGFSLVFMALGASASLIGKLLLQYISIFSKIAGVLIILLGLHLLGVLKLGMLNYQKQMKLDRFKPGYFGAFLIGIAFAFGWSPCVGPILAGILALAATQETMLRGMMMLGAYSIGLGIPFIMTGFAVGLFMKFFEKYKKFIRWGEMIAGLFLIVIGVLIFTESLSLLLKYIPPVFYEFAK